MDAEELLACGTRAVEVDGDLRAGRDWLEAAYREAERGGDTHLVAAAAIGLGGWWVGEHRTAAAAGLLRARLSHALTLVDPDSADGVRLRMRLAAEADYRDGGHAAVLAALDEARRRPDPALRAEALRLAHHCLLGPDHGDVRRALADELVGEAGHAASRTGDRGHLLMGLLYQAVDLFLAGHPHAHRRLAELRAELGRGEHLAVGYVVSAIDVMLAIRSGRLDDAERLAADCAELGGKAGDGDTAAFQAAQLVAIRWFQGRLPDLLPTLAELVDVPDLSAVDNSFHAAHAVAAAAAGDRPTAMRAMAALQRPTLDDLPRHGSWLATIGGFAEAAYLVGDAHAAATAYRLLTPYADLPIMASLAVTCFGSVEYALGVAAMTTGDLDAAVAHLTRAVRRNLAFGHWPAVIRSRLRLAEALDHRAAPNDPATATSERHEAATTASRLDLPLPTLPTPAPPPPATTVPATGTGGVPAPDEPGMVAACRRAGRGWRIDLGQRVTHVGHSVGMLHLAVLIANPGNEIPAIDLVAGMTALARAARSATTQPVLDPTAVRHYRQRLTELDGRGSDGHGGGERGWLVAELTAHARPGGRVRAFTDDAERARLAVGRAIRRALDHVDRADPVIGGHLRAAVHTGIRCWYRPL